MQNIMVVWGAPDERHHQRISANGYMDEEACEQSFIRFITDRGIDMSSASWIKEDEWVEAFEVSKGNRR